MLNRDQAKLSCLALNMLNKLTETFKFYADASCNSHELKKKWRV